ncbi:unnamed protein product [Ixodes hexagonus]
MKEMKMPSPSSPPTMLKPRPVGPLDSTTLRVSCLPYLGMSSSLGALEVLRFVSLWYSPKDSFGHSRGGVPSRVSCTGGAGGGGREWWTNEKGWLLTTASTTWSPVFFSVATASSGVNWNDELTATSLSPTSSLRSRCAAPPSMTLVT